MLHRSDHYPELPASPVRIAIFGGLALAAGVLASIWMTQTHGPKYPGYLSVRNTLITARGPCRVAALAAREGAPIRISDPVVVLQDEQLLQQIGLARGEASAMESELARVEAEAALELKWRMKSLEAEICEIQLRSAGYLKEKYEFDLQRALLSESMTDGKVVTRSGRSIPVQNVALESPLPAPDRLATVFQMESASNAFEVSAAQVEICGQRETRLTELKKELPQQIEKIMGVDVAKEKLHQSQQKLATLESQESRLTVSSPAIGHVGNYRVRPGDHLKEGDPIVELLDQSERNLVVHVPSQAIPQFAVGQRVNLTFPGKLRRTGEVCRIAPQALAGPGQSGEVTVLVHVEPRGVLWPETPIGTMVSVQPVK